MAPVVFLFVTEPEFVKELLELIVTTGDAAPMLIEPVLSIVMSQGVLFAQAVAVATAVLVEVVISRSGGVGVWAKPGLESRAAPATESISLRLVTESLVLFAANLLRRLPRRDRLAFPLFKAAPAAPAP